MVYFGDFGLTKMSSEPVRFKKIPFKEPIKAFIEICNRYDNAFLFETMRSDFRGSTERFSFIGFEPEVVIKVKDHNAIVDDSHFKVDCPLEPIKALIREKPQKSTFRYIGGAVGYISYDAIRYWERLPKTSVDDLGFPDLEMGVYSDGMIFDLLSHEAFYFYRGKCRLNEVLKLMKKSSETLSLDFIEFTTPKVNIDRERYDKMVEKAKEYIYSGEVFQVVLSKRISANFKGGLERFYLNLKRINPSPYMFFIKMDGNIVIGSSPETLVRVEDGVVETSPIAGTRAVTGDPERDEALANEMINDPKELAEHAMLLDLARSDVGKVSEYGSVKVVEFMKIYRYSHVQHLVSKVIGKLRRDRDCFDALKALFPAGTVSGAPKVRAMEIIEELEGVRRGPYAGAVGYFSYNGNMDFAITIRALFAKSGRFHVQVGSGIVADSTPEKEWLETELKSKAIMEALERACK